MANIERIKKHIGSQEIRLSKLQDKLKRIKIAEESNWQNNPYCYDATDLKYVQSDIESIEKLLKQYQTELKAEELKNQSRNCEPILAFLNSWKQRCLDYYSEGIKRAFDAKAQLQLLADRFYQLNVFDSDPKEYEKAKQDYSMAHAEYSVRLHGEYETQIIKSRRMKIKTKSGDLEYVANLMRSTYSESVEKLEADLADEVKQKYDLIIERTTKHVGIILDASDLRVSETGELNGRIIGSDGQVNVRTIGAGGYNIQRFHFRTIITPIC